MKLNKPENLQTIAAFLNSEFDGDPEFEIAGINEIHMVKPGDLTFVDHPKYYDKALGSAATTIIINKKVEKPEGKALIFSDDPFAAYMELVKKYRPFEPASKMISDTAEIGEGTIIQPGAFVGEHVQVGKNCIIHANVSIYSHSIIGNNVIIHSGSVIGGMDFIFRKEKMKP